MSNMTTRELDLKDMAQDASFLYGRYKKFEKEKLSELKADIAKVQKEYSDIPAAKGVFNAIGALVVGAYNEQLYLEKVKAQRELIEKQFMVDLNNAVWLKLSDEEKLNGYIEKFDVLKGAKSFDAVEVLKKIVSELQASRKE